MPWNRLSRSCRNLRIAGDYARTARAHPATQIQRRTQGRGSQKHAHDASGRDPQSGRWHYDAGRDFARLFKRHGRMTSFRYQAVGGDGGAVNGTIEAEDRKSALLQLGELGLFPSTLETDGSAGKGAREAAPTASPAPF